MKKGGVQVYETALRCAVNEDLGKEWEKYLEETRKHVRVLTDVCRKRGLTPEQNTPGQQVVRHVGRCVVLAETKDHLDWELIGKCSEKLKGDQAKALKAAYEEIEAATPGGKKTRQDCDRCSTSGAGKRKAQIAQGQRGTEHMSARSGSYYGRNRLRGSADPRTSWPIVR